MCHGKVREEFYDAEYPGIQGPMGSTTHWSTRRTAA